MPKFSEISKARLGTCHPKLQSVMNEAIKYVDFSVICGYRNEDEQNKAFHDGFSTKEFPDSKHNKVPSLAIDIAPYPQGFSATSQEFYFLAGYILSIAAVLGVSMRWGGRWKTLVDLPHFELTEEGASDEPEN